MVSLESTPIDIHSTCQADRPVLGSGEQPTLYQHVGQRSPIRDPIRDPIPISLPPYPQHDESGLSSPFIAFHRQPPHPARWRILRAAASCPPHRPPASHIPHPTSHIPHPASHIPHPTPRTPHPTSHIPHPHPISHIPNPTSSSLDPKVPLVDPPPLVDPKVPLADPHAQIPAPDPASLPRFRWGGSRSGSDGSEERVATLGCRGGARCSAHSPSVQSRGDGASCRDGCPRAGGPRPQGSGLGMNESLSGLRADAQGVGSGLRLRMRFGVG